MTHSTIKIYQTENESDQISPNQAILHSADSSSILANTTVDSGRSYLISVPDNYTKSTTWPLIVDFHGRNGSPGIQWNNSQYFLNPLGKEYIVAYPLGCLGQDQETA